jgi:cation transport regulator ChaC
MTGMTKVGILAYGSLISFPGGEIEGARVETTPNVLSPFKVEICAIQQMADQAPRHVFPSAMGKQVKAIIFAMNVPKEEAIHILYRREINKVGSKQKYDLSKKIARTMLSSIVSKISRASIWYFTRVSAQISTP